jgi:hypothetical protein
MPESDGGSTGRQPVAAQNAQLTPPDCTKIYSEKISGGDRAMLAKLLKQLSA